MIYCNVLEHGEGLWRTYERALFRSGTVMRVLLASFVVGIVVFVCVGFLTQWLLFFSCDCMFLSQLYYLRVLVIFVLGGCLVSFSVVVVSIEDVLSCAVSLDSRNDGSICTSCHSHSICSEVVVVLVVLAL